MSTLTLHHYLEREERLHEMDPKLAPVLLSIADACKSISHLVRRGALEGVLGLAGTENVQGEDQKKLDVISNEIFVDALVNSGAGSACPEAEKEAWLGKQPGGSL